MRKVKAVAFALHRFTFLNAGRTSNHFLDYRHRQGTPHRQLVSNTSPRRRRHRSAFEAVIVCHVIPLAQNFVAFSDHNITESSPHSLHIASASPQSLVGEHTTMTKSLFTLLLAGFLFLSACGFTVLPQTALVRRRAIKTETFLFGPPKDDGSPGE